MSLGRGTDVPLYFTRFLAKELDRANIADTFLGDPGHVAHGVLCDPAKTLHKPAIEHLPKRVMRQHMCACGGGGGVKGALTPTATIGRTTFMICRVSCGDTDSIMPVAKTIREACRKPSLILCVNAFPTKCASLFNR